MLRQNYIISYFDISHAKYSYVGKWKKCKHCSYRNQVRLFARTPITCVHETLRQVALEVGITYLVCPLCDAGFHQDVLIVKHMHRKCVKLKTIDWPENVFKTYILEPCAML